MLTRVPLKPFKLITHACTLEMSIWWKWPQESAWCVIFFSTQGRQTHRQGRKVRKKMFSGQESEESSLTLVYGKKKKEREKLVPLYYIACCQWKTITDQVQLFTETHSSFLIESSTLFTLIQSTDHKRTSSNLLLLFHISSHLHLFFLSFSSYSCMCWCEVTYFCLYIFHAQ